MAEEVTNEEKEQHSDLEILEFLKNKLFHEFKEDKSNVKVGDLLKVLEMKNKLSVTGKAEKKFWEMINKIREAELSGKGKKRTKKPATSK
jgi:hypothetical protein